MNPVSLLTYRRVYDIETGHHPGTIRYRTIDRHVVIYCVWALVVILILLTALVFKHN